MTEIETFPTTEEAEALLAAMDRLFETQDAIAASKNSFDAYWAGSAWASVARDVKAGRVRRVGR